MGATLSGELRHRIGFERAATSRSALGRQTQDGWTSVGFTRAKVLYGTGAERRQAAVEEGSQGATFRCRSTATTRGVQVNDRIVHAGQSWDIVGRADLGGNPAEIEFTAVTSRG